MDSDVYGSHDAVLLVCRALCRTTSDLRNRVTLIQTLSGEIINSKNAIRMAVAGVALCAASVASIVPAQAAGGWTGCGSEALCLYQNAAGGGAVLSISLSSLKNSGWVNLTNRTMSNGWSANDQVSSVWLNSSSTHCAVFATDINGGGSKWGWSNAKAGGKLDQVPDNDQYSSVKYDSCT